VNIFGTGLYDDCMFLAIILTGFYGLMHIGELTQSHVRAKWSFLKTTLCHSPKFSAHSFSFHLPFHKGDQLFDGNMIMIEAHHGSLICAHSQMTIYTALHDVCFGVYLELWLTSDANIPMYSWCISHLWKSLDNEVEGHSLCSRGATALALAGVNNDSIQAMGIGHFSNLHKETSSQLACAHSQQASFWSHTELIHHFFDHHPPLHPIFFKFTFYGIYSDNSASRCVFSYSLQCLL